MVENGTIKEFQRRIFELTLALYRVTDFFPQGEALRRNLREKANEVFGGVVEYRVSSDSRDAAVIAGKVESIKGYLRVARAMQFVKPINLTVLERAYQEFLDFFGGEFAGEEKEEPMERNPRKEVAEETLKSWNDFSKGDKKPVHISLDLNARQKKILAHIKATEHARVSDFFGVFEDISSKTIQRDLQDLVSRNMLKKEGEKRWTTYFLEGNVQ